MEIQHCMGMFLIQWELDPFGLDWKDLLETGLGHHLFPRSVAKKIGIEEWAKLTAYSWYPYEPAGSGRFIKNFIVFLLSKEYLSTEANLWEHWKIFGS